MKSKIPNQKTINSIVRVTMELEHSINSVFSISKNSKLRKNYTVNELDEMSEVAGLIAEMDCQIDDTILKHIKYCHKRLNDLATHCREAFPIQIYNFLERYYPD